MSFIQHALAPAAVLALACATGTPASAQSRGSWEGPFPLPLPGIHAVLLPPEGKVLWYSYPISDGFSEAWVFDPATQTLKEYPIKTNIFCGAHGHRGNGDVLIIGGTQPGRDPRGEEEAWTFREPGGFLSELPMADGRWYPTVTKLMSGRLMALSGLDSQGALNTTVETWSKNKGWRILAGADIALPLYPMSFLSPTGDIFIAGPDKFSQMFDVQTTTWSAVATLASRHLEGTAVMLPELGKVMVMGGHNLTHKLTWRRVEVIDLNDANPQWTSVASLNKKRHHANSVLLPDATVLIVAGERLKKNGESVPVRRPEVYDPQTDTWTLLKIQTRPRMYHSTAVLLRDGRVVSAGGDGELTYEIFSPPYLFKGPRPGLTAVPPIADHGTSIQVSTDQADQIASACLIAPSAVTHSFNQNQRYVPLVFQKTGRSVLTIDLPSSKAVAPPGYYMLFLVNATGVPSIGEFLRLTKK